MYTCTLPASPSSSPVRGSKSVPAKQQLQKKKKNGGSDNGKRGREKSMLINPTFLLNYLYCSSSTDGSTAILSFPSWCFFTICIYLYIYIYISLFCRFLNRQRGKIRAIIVRHRKTNTCATKTTTKKKRREKEI